MDEVIGHCMRELAFDGDLDFYESHSSSQAQKLDDAFYAFFWSVIVQQPGVRVGKLPEIVPADVEDEGPRRKSGTTHSKGQESVELVAIEDAAVRPLDDLVTEYGDQLRIAVERDRVSMALIGSHIRPAKLTPPVFTALQLVARGRDAGISTIELSDQAGYDAKTCHYLISKLLELNLVEKRKKTGVGAHVIIHKYFFERSPVWQAVVAEEAEAADTDLIKAELEGEDEGDDDVVTQANVTFEPLDSKHLASLPIIRARIVKLLQASPYHMHPVKNIMLRIVRVHFGGGKEPDSDIPGRASNLDRERVTGEKVQTPHPTRKGANLMLIRLLSADEQKDVGDEEDAEAEDDDDIEENVFRLKGNETLHRQLIELVEASGTEGTTVTSLSQSLCNFDRRIVELLLTRLEQYPPPPHLADLGICQLQESAGRERRFKFFTMANFHALSQKEGMSSAYLDNDLSHAGEFMDADEELFFDEEQDHDKFVDNFVRAALPGTKGKALKTPATPKVKKPAKEKAPPKPPKPPKPSKPPKHKNPVLADGTVKKGRPRKYARGDGQDGSTPAPRGTKRKREEEVSEVPVEEPGADTETAQAQVEDAPPPPKKRRGRPPKAKPLPPTETPEASASADVEMVTEQPAAPTPDVPEPITPKTRGRKSQAPAETPRQRRTSRRLTNVTQEEAEHPGVDTADAQATIVPDTPPVEPEPSVPEESIARPSSSTVLPPASSSNLDKSFNTITAPNVAQSPVPTTSTSAAPIVPPDGVPESASSLSLDPSLQLHDSSLISFDAPTESDPATSTTKRAHSASTPASDHPSKRAKTAGPESERVKGNISHARREKELLQVVIEADGFINVSTKEFAEAHAALVDRMMKAGEPVSSRVTTARVDKRTVESTLNSLEAKGKIKLISSSVTLVTGSVRKIKVAYLPEKSEEELASFLSDIGRTILPFGPSPHVRVVDTPISLPKRKESRAKTTPAPAPPRTVPVSIHYANTNNSTEAAKSLPQRDEADNPDSFLTDRDTIAQLYGFVPGKVARAEALHVLTLQQFESQADLPGIVSRDARIINVSFYTQSITVASYCSLVKTLETSTELSNLLESPQGPKTLLSDLPVSVQRLLQIDKTRSQTRILDLLDVLHALGLVVPLRPATSDHSAVSIPPSGSHPTSFEEVEDDAGEQGNTQYWKFTTSAPIFLWSLKDKDVPPKFWKDVPVGSAQEAESYWSDLETACLKPKSSASIAATLPESTREFKIPSNMLKLIRRIRAWSTEYSLSSDQTEYMRRFVSVPNRMTPLQDSENGPTQMAKISSVTSAPLDVVKQFYEREFLRITSESEKLQSKSQKRTDERTKNKESLMQRAASAKQQRENVWDELVRKVHPEPLKGTIGARVRRVRTRFLQSSGTDLEKWETEIAQAIEEAKLAAAKVIGAIRPAAPAIAASASTSSAGQQLMPPPTIARSVPEKSVETLIAQQGPPLEAKAPVKKKKKGKEAGEESATDVRRRHRFQWTRDYDDLARDASAIIRARCRNGARLDWAALEQVFPAVPRNSVRQRVISLLKEAGAEAYMKRLEDRWYELWVQHRGTDALPDPDPESPSNLDMIAHVKFLRNHVDKTALRIGFVETEQAITVTLPSSVADFEKSWHVSEKGVAAPMYDFMWSLPSEESREKHLLQMALVSDVYELPQVRSYSSEAVHVADAALKMALGTPNDTYDLEAASALLKSVGEGPVTTATADLLERGVLSKVVRDPSKSKPGRTLRISEINQNALGGSISAELYQDAAAYEEFFLKGDGATEWREWTLLATDGDTAALIDLVSENKIELKLDTSLMKFAHNGDIDWNSKKIDDDDIEIAVHARSLMTPPAAAEEASPSPGPAPDTSTLDLPATSVGPDLHGYTNAVDPAACRKNTAGPVDCDECLEESAKSLGATLNTDESSISSLLQSYLAQAVSKGLTKAQLKANFTASDAAKLSTVVTHLTDAPVPLAFWAGYKEIVLVSSTHVRAWTVVTSQGDDGLVRAFPRRWLDLSGSLVKSVWDAALKAVMGVIVFRPGLTQAEIRWRLRSVYDRQEINELLQHLMEEGYAKRHVEAHDLRWACCGMPDDEEEKMTFWTVGEKKHWFSVFPEMRMHNVFSRVPVPANVKLFWDRVTISKITTIYFIFSVLHCIIQVIFQAQAFSINAKAATFLGNIIAQGNTSTAGFAIFGGSDLQWCTSVPASGDTSSCNVIWSLNGANNAAALGTGLNSTLYNSTATSASPSGSAYSALADTAPSPSVSPVRSSSVASVASVPPISDAVATATASPSVSSIASTSSIISSATHNTSSALSSATTATSQSSSAAVTSVATRSTSATGSASSASPSQQSVATEGSTRVLTVTVAPSAFSHEAGFAAVSQSVTRTFTVVVTPSATPTSTAAAGHDVDDDADEEHEGNHKRDQEVVGAVAGDGSKEVQINDFNGGKQITLDDKCLMALNWPESQVKNTKREDIVFICFQIWVLGMSLVALLNESIPHIFASLLTHIVATAWGGFQMFNTQEFHSDFVRLTTNGACGVNLLPTYWKARANAEIPSLVLNCVALLVSAFLSWRLVKLFGWQTFKRVGASLTINRVYNVVLVLSIVIQLSGFFIAVSGGLWIDQVFNGEIGRFTTRPSFFKALMIIVLVLLLPWLTIGWISVRRELRIGMLIFLFLSFLYLVGWSAMFVSNTFRLTFQQWRFFSLMTSASVFLAAVTVVLGILCRINFGKGLRRHLEGQEVLQDESPDYENEKSYSDEKFDFPSSNTPIPTFSAAFGSGPEVPPPSQMNFAPRTAGAPRFYGPSTFDPNGAIAYGVASPPRAESPSSVHSPEKGLIRHGSASSQHSVSSTSSTSSSGHSTGSNNTSRSKRWIIE
ncbi:hypothetical protein EIP91_002353 [Steccherinum ochraceum]|uniref:Uncharacterized protein n=1 Tax=Steccherinum ochraceum TaxID=92696 RepID=A0A4R0S2J5_9APHY|nr:hypothetical protein EIP91_002353 [Steccherinum ochraceum]